MRKIKRAVFKILLFIYPISWIIAILNGDFLFTYLVTSGMMHLLFMYILFFTDEAKDYSNVHVFWLFWAFIALSPIVTFLSLINGARCNE